VHEIYHHFDIVQSRGISWPRAQNDMTGRGDFFIFKINVIDIHDNSFEFKMLSFGCLLRFKSLILNNLKLSINITVGNVYYLII